VAELSLAVPYGVARPEELADWGAGMVSKRITVALPNGTTLHYEVNGIAAELYSGELDEIKEVLDQCQEVNEEPMTFYSTT
jgi:hypothetical protein